MLSVHDVFSNYLEVSPESVDVTGWPQESLLGCSGVEFVHPDDMPVVEEAYDRSLREKRAMHLVCRTEGREGYVWVATRFHPEEDEQGMYLVAATQAVPAPADGKAWFRAAETNEPARPDPQVEPDQERQR